MTKRDDNAIRLAVERELGGETHSALFRLGVFCLVALLFMALFLVGGSFSRNTSEGDVTASGLSLKTATFDVEVEEGGYYEGDKYESGDEYGIDTKQYVIYAFTVTNNSDVDITYDMSFELTISVPKPGVVINLESLQFILVDPGNEDNNIDFDDAVLTGANNYTVTIEYSTEGSGGAFFLGQKSNAAVVLIVNQNDCYSNETNLTFVISGKIEITAVNQAKEVIE